ncbi:MAG: hypothetical protein HQ546_05410 [Planctomycetes bacterium]|nr:hypothetical protein [Planctomycetota bacterium]
MRLWLVILFAAGLVCTLPAGVPALAGQTDQVSSGDSRLQAATELVLGSDRYLHHSKLKRGMTGYGLTVLEGTRIVRFDVEIVSVMTNFEPNRDLILARLTDPKLKRLGVISGMSGSPVYVRDGGVDKMIGAVAYGWSFQKEIDNGPLAGIQPIAQMLVLTGETVLPSGGQPVDSQAAQSAGPAGGLCPSATWLAEVLEVKKVDFTRFGWPSRKGGVVSASASNMPNMRPLSTPLMMGGMCERTMEHLLPALAEWNFLPVQAGGLGIAPEQVEDIKLEPGSTLAIPIVSGDRELTLIGTVTEVIGDRIIALGHAMLGGGTVSFPLATGYVHTVMPSIISSFKMGGSVRIVGQLNDDETTAVGGTVGAKIDLVPLSVRVVWDESGQEQSYHYSVIRDRRLAAMLMNMVTIDSLWSTRMLPIEHAIEYAVDIDFGELGRYRVTNLSSGADISEVASDLARPIGVMLNNPFGTARIGSVSIEARIHSGARLAVLLGVTTDRNCYAPGQTIRAVATLKRFKGPRMTRAIEIALPADLPEGKYTLRVGDWEMAVRDEKRRRPRQFDPRTLTELLAAVQRICQGRMDRLYAVVDLPGEDLAVKAQTLPDAPQTVAAALKSAEPLDVSPIARAVTADFTIGLVVKGSVQSSFEVNKHPPGP